MKDMKTFMETNEVDPPLINDDLIAAVNAKIMKNETDPRTYPNNFLRILVTSTRDNVRKTEILKTVCSVGTSQSYRTTETDMPGSTLDHQSLSILSNSPDLAISGFHAFKHLKSFLASKQFQKNEEVKSIFARWLQSQAAPFFYERIQTLVCQ